MPSCPSRVALDRIGDRWTALIVGLLENGPRRFTEIRDAVGISPKVLTRTLRSLERDGLLVRRAYAEIPPRVEYELTPLGLTLHEPMAAIRDWAKPISTRSSRHASGAPPTMSGRRIRSKIAAGDLAVVR